MESYFEGTLEDTLRWELLEQITEVNNVLGEVDEANGRRCAASASKSVYSLQREYVCLFGNLPKLETRIYGSCGVCEQVFNPQVVASHKEHCTGKGRVQQQSKRRTKSKRKQAASIPLPPLFKESPSPPVLSKFSDVTPPQPSRVAPPQPSRVAPPQSSRVAPPQPSRAAPPQSSRVAPPQPSRAAPPQSSRVTPPQPSRVTPPQPSRAAPPQPSRVVPDAPPLSEPPPAAAPTPTPTPPPTVASAPNVEDPPRVLAVVVVCGGGGSSSPPRVPPIPVVPSPGATREETPSKHSKSRKKEYDPDVHCGVTDGQKGPCMRSITCSNHKIQLRKSVPGRSKNIHTLIADKKAAKESKEKEKESTRRRSPTHLLALEPKSEFVLPLLEAEKERKTPSITPAPKNAKTELHEEVESDEPSIPSESGYCSIDTSVSTKSSPVLYFNPISPIFVVTPLQLIQKENSVFAKPQHADSPPPNGYFLTLPEPSANLKLYKSHPKPTILPTYGARKVGGAILSSNQRVEYQRNDIQMAITTRRMAAATNNCRPMSFVPAQRSILFKKGINCKRASTEKISASDGKQIKLAADVNGFILHTDMSELTETPQSNHCIQENINLLNMK